MENTNKKLKVGVLTFHRCINYGSYWQTRCMVEGLQAQGHDTVVLDHYSRRVNLAEWKCALQPVLPLAVTKADHLLYRQKMEKFFCAFKSLPLSPAFPLDDPSQMEEYDVVVVGSDEVWNLSHPWYGYCPLFYGDGIHAKKLISYAASFGNYDASWGLDSDWAKKLCQFESISVRDENSRNIIKNALGFEPEMVLDPCLQFPIHPEKRELPPITRPYAAVYGHNFSEFFIRNIRKWADERKLPLISIGYRNDWADEQWLMADPHDFAAFISRSEAVITNFFHGCVFALINSKPFVCETSPYRTNKVQGLMKKIGGEKHLVMEGTPAGVYNELLLDPLDAEMLNKIAELRIISGAYLNKSLAQKRLELL